MKKPNALLYLLFFLLIYPFLKIAFRLKVDKSAYRVPDGPFVVVSNHESFMDFCLAMLTIYPRRLNAVAAQKFFFFPPLNTLLPMMGCIPKNLFDADPRAIKDIFQVIKGGGNLLLFPEGRCSTHGEYMGMHVACGKLLKKLAVPVVACHIEGAYGCMPFWRPGIRCGRVRVTLSNLLTPAELKDLSVTQVNEQIDSAIGTKSPGDGAFFSLWRARRLACGLENIIYLCPGCRQEFSLETKGNTIACTACGLSAQLGKDAHFIWARDGVVADGGTFNPPETVAAWFKLQCGAEMDKISTDFEPISSQVSIRIGAGSGKGLMAAGVGTLSLDLRGWHYRGQFLGEETTLDFPLDTVPALPFDPADNFQIYGKGRFFAFCPTDNKKACVKYAVLGECMYWRFAQDVQMTPGSYPFTPLETTDI